MDLPSSAQLHLALTHLPVVAALLAAATLVVAAVTGARATRRFGLVLLVVAGASAVPAYLTGEGAEEIVEHRPGVVEAIVERHEEAAEKVLLLTVGAALIAAGALVASRARRERLARALFHAALVIALADGAALAWVAHLGGEIRHDEIRLAKSPAGPAATRLAASDD